MDYYGSYKSHITFGDNSHGFRNAKDISNGLDRCTYGNVRGPIKDLLRLIFGPVSDNEVIYCRLLTRCKPDLSIRIGSISKNVSIFTGSGNSVHQENIDGFISFCSSIGLTKDEECSLRLVYYGDGTLNGTGPIRNRLTANEIKNEYSIDVDIAQRFFDCHRRELAKRFLVTGKDLSNPQADYVFHGTNSSGISCSYKDVLDYIENCKSSNNGLLSIGPLSFQMWNRNLDGDYDKENKRESLQIKWPSMPDHIMYVKRHLY